MEKDLGETSIKVITHTWEIGELASVKRKLWMVEKKKKKKQGMSGEEYLHLGVRKRKKSNCTSQRSWE